MTQVSSGCVILPNWSSARWRWQHLDDDFSGNFSNKFFQDSLPWTCGMVMERESPQTRKGYGSLPPKKKTVERVFAFEFLVKVWQPAVNPPCNWTQKNHWKSKIWNLEEAQRYQPQRWITIKLWFQRSSSWKWCKLYLDDVFQSQRNYPSVWTSGWKNWELHMLMQFLFKAQRDLRLSNPTSWQKQLISLPRKTISKDTYS